MKRICPTIQELLAFDAVARHQSVTRAAENLCVSVSAVSKRIAALEAYLKRPLLDKSGRGVQLNATGRDYWVKVSSALRMIETATCAVQEAGAASDTLVVSSVPTFLTTWLIPRLADFRRRHPAVSFAFRQHIDLRDSFPSDVDAAICLGRGDRVGIRSDYVAGREFVCICAPTLVVTGPPIETRTDLLAHPLLHLDGAPCDWSAWAARYGLDVDKAQQGPRFAQYSAVIEAACSGLGVGLVPRMLVARHLQQGLLQGLFEFSDADQGHHLCFRDERLAFPAFAAFRSWLLEQGRGATRHDPGWESGGLQANRAAQDDLASLECS